MKWETFNKLSVIDKEEYKFRFNKYHEFELPINLQGIVTLYSLFTLSLLIWYMSYTNKELNIDITYQSTIFSQMILITTGIIIFELIIYIIIKIYGYYLEKNWLKQRGL